MASGLPFPKYGNGCVTVDSCFRFKLPKTLMAIETERKYRLDIDEASRFTTALTDLGADFRGLFEEENIVFSSRELSDQGAVVRIRNIPGRSILTFKRNLGFSDDYKQHLEIETAIEDATAMERILEEIGLRKTLVYEKRRRSWRFRNVEIVIDELPFGIFMEIEGEKTDIDEAEAVLGIGRLEKVRQTYPRLTMIFGTDRNGVIEARFEKGN